MAINCRWEQGFQRYYDSATGETVHVNAPVWHKDDFIKEAIGSDEEFKANGTGVSVAAVQDAVGGYLRLTTDGADNSNSLICTPLHFEAAQSACMEAKITLVSAAAVSFFVGFTDAQDETQLLPFNLSGTTVTSTASNACGIYGDTDATNDNFHAQAVKADTDATLINSGTAFDTSAHICQVSMNPSGDCSYWLNGALLGTSSAGITTTTDLCVMVGVMAMAAAAKSIDIDYIAWWGGRA